MQIQTGPATAVGQIDVSPDQTGQALANAKPDQLIQARVQAASDGSGAIINLLGNTFRVPPSLDLPMGSQVLLRVMENSGGRLQLDIFSHLPQKGATSSQRAGDSAGAQELGTFEATVELEIPSSEVVSRKASTSNAEWQALSDEDYTGQHLPTKHADETETPDAAGKAGDSKQPATTRQSSSSNVRIPPAIADRLDAYQTYASEAADATAASDVPALMQRKVDFEMNLPAESAPAAAALARAGLPVTTANVVSIRQALALGLARSPETLAWLRAAHVEATPERTAALDSVLMANATKLGALLAQSTPGTAENLQPMLLHPERPPAEVASVLRDVLTHLTHAEAGATKTAAQSAQLVRDAFPALHPDADPRAADVATNLRGQLLLPAVQARTDAPPQGLYLQMPVQMGAQLRTLELKITQRHSSQSHHDVPDITDISVRLDTEAFGPVDARLTALGRNVALAFTFQNAGALRTFQNAQEELRAGLAEQNVACGAIVCRVAPTLPPLTHDGRLNVDARG